MATGLSLLSEWRTVLIAPRKGCDAYRRGGLPPALDREPCVSVTADVGTFWLPAGDGVMRPFLQRCGTWDPAVGGLLRRLLRPGARFLDVGAGIGYFSVL